MTTQVQGSEGEHKRPLEGAEDNVQVKERKVELTETKDEAIPTNDLQQQEPNLNLVIFGLPKYMDHKQFNKILTAQSVTCKKAKKMPKQEFGFLYCETLAQKEEAAKKLGGFEVKGKKLTVQDMKGKGSGKSGQRQKPQSKTDGPESNEPPNVNKSTAPLWNMPYSEQLEKKAKHAKDIIQRIVKQIRQDSKNSKLDWVIESNSFPFEGVRPAPITNKYPAHIVRRYRNKVQFTIGFDIADAPCIGFVAGKFLTGQHVIPPVGAVTVPDEAQHVRDAFQEFIVSSALPPYRQQSHSGFWRLLTVKAFSRTNEVMAIVQVNPKAPSSPEQYENEKQRLVSFFDAKQKTGLVITSLMLQEYSGVASDSPLRTIGQCIAESVKEVLGIEMSEDAVEDAKVNAELNGHKNTRYIAGKVEDVLASSFSTLPSGPIIAVVDPPRPGLHKSVLTAIRSNKFIKRLVYVSCEPQSLIANCSMLCRTESNSAVGIPFVPVTSVAVDMFPHTDKLEMVVLFDRLYTPSSTTTNTPSTSTTTTTSTPSLNVTKFDAENDSITPTTDTATSTTDTTTTSTTSATSTSPTSPTSPTSSTSSTASTTSITTSG